MVLSLLPLVSAAPVDRDADSWSAQTLAPGQFQLGTHSGAAPIARVEVGTSTLPLLAGAPNVDLKVQAVATAPFDLALVGGYARFHGEGLEAWTVRAGGRASAWAGPFSVHGSVLWHGAMVTGSLEETWLATVPPLSWAVEGGAGFADLDDAIDAVRPAVAIAWAVTDTDTVVLRGEGWVWAWIDPIPGLELYGLDDLQGHKGPLPLRDTYVASVSLQHTWDHARLRAGLGTSAVPLAWVVQTVELSWRFGGPTGHPSDRSEPGEAQASG